MSTLKREKENTNQVELYGTIETPFTFSHVHRDVKYYRFILGVERLSGCVDKIPCIISENSTEVEADYTGKKCFVSGKYKSYNNYNEQGKATLVLNVSVKILDFVDEFPSKKDTNSIKLSGFICKPVNLRKITKKQEKEDLQTHIADICLAVNNSSKHCDYIPCVAWRDVADCVQKFDVGDFVVITGRIQSREYFKKIEDSEEVIAKTAYEVSCKTVYRKDYNSKKEATDESAKELTSEETSKMLETSE